MALGRRNKGTDVIRILSDCSVDGTMYPFRHAFKVNLSANCPCPEGVVGRDVGGADMTCTMDCDSMLWISMVSFGSKAVTYG